MTGGAGEQDEWGREVQHRSTFYYADYGLVESTNLLWLQGAFNTLTGMFERVGLWKKVGKTARMIFCPCQVEGTQLETSYERQVMGTE